MAINSSEQVPGQQTDESSDNEQNREADKKPGGTSGLGAAPTGEEPQSG
jgi:hypothetical protein